LGCARHGLSGLRGIAPDCGVKGGNFRRLSADCRLLSRCPDHAGARPRIVKLLALLRTYLEHFGLKAHVLLCHRLTFRHGESASTRRALSMAKRGMKRGGLAIGRPRLNFVVPVRLGTDGLGVEPSNRHLIRLPRFRAFGQVPPLHRAANITRASGRTALRPVMALATDLHAPWRRARLGIWASRRVLWWNGPHAVNPEMCAVFGRGNGPTVSVSPVTSFSELLGY